MQPKISNTSDKPRRCGGCNNMESNCKINFKTCSNCKVVFSCSKKCQVNSWNHHKNLCQTINYLEQQHLAHISKQTTFNTQLPKEKAKLANVIGHECNLHCKLNDYYCKLFLDTGPQVSLLSKDWLQKNISKFEILDLRELLDGSDKIRVQWENNTNIPFAGWVNLEIQLEGSHTVLSNVPVLLTSNYMERPALGFNVIKETLQDDQRKDDIINILTKSFGKSPKFQAISKSVQQKNQKVDESTQACYIKECQCPSLQTQTVYVKEFQLQTQ